VSETLAGGLVRNEDEVVRCWWGGGDHLEYRAYHDDEWGMPVTDDVRLFEKLSLEGFQSGLSWLTILRKREAFRRAFAGFDFRQVASFGPPDVERLLQDASIVRHRGKIESTVNNAARILEVRDELGSFDALVWSFVGGAPIVHSYTTLAELPSATEESRLMSKDLKRRGFRFVGPTTMYALMQAAGLVDDHVMSCFRHRGGTDR
jgi:DNA-3-methyladenine glycosylase I